jgi:hypothetical protein
VSVVPSEEHELLAERLPGNHALLRQLLRDAGGLELSTLSPLPGSEKVPSCWRSRARGW